MKGYMSRIRDRRVADRISGNHAVVEIVDGLIAKHGADALLLGTVLGDAKAAYWHAFTTMHLIDSRSFLVAAHCALDAFDRVLVTAKQMDAEGERAFVPLLHDLKRRVVAAQDVPDPTRRPRRQRVPAGAAR